MVANETKGEHGIIACFGTAITIRLQILSRTNANVAHPRRFDSEMTNFDGVGMASWRARRFPAEGRRYNRCMTTYLAGIDFSAPSHEVARLLIGVTVLVDGVGGRIVETEAYDREDPASHTYNGPTARNAAMFGPPAHAYVYRSYGIHWCLNFVCREEGHGAGVLIRAIEPLHGLDTMALRRGLDDPRLLTSGPGRVCQALGVTREHNGKPLALAPFQLLPRDAAADLPVAAGPRIGISKAMDTPWRFGVARSPYLSKPFRP
jgi:DNA-3-methyladenine glycosylase